MKRLVDPEDSPDLGASTIQTREQPCDLCGRNRTERLLRLPATVAEKFGASEMWSVDPCTSWCERKRELAEWEEQTREAHIGQLRRESNLPERLKHYSLINYKQVTPNARRGLGVALGYFETFPERSSRGEGLYFVGGPGTGKTHLAVGLMNMVMTKFSTPCLFGSVPEILDKLRNSYDLEGYPDALDMYKNAPFLILDDLGAERATEWVRERMFLIINARYISNLPTIITSNIGASEVRSQLGERIESRLNEMCEWVDMGNVDYRKRPE